MANSSIEDKFERLRVRVEGLNMSEKAKADFFQSEWNRLCKQEEKEKERKAMLKAEQKKFAIFVLTLQLVDDMTSNRSKMYYLDLHILL